MFVSSATSNSIPSHKAVPWLNQNPMPVAHLVAGLDAFNASCLRRVLRNIHHYSESFFQSFTIWITCCGWYLILMGSRKWMDGAEIATITIKWQEYAEWWTMIMLMRQQWWLWRQRRWWMLSVWVVYSSNKFIIIVPGSQTRAFGSLKIDSDKKTLVIFSLRNTHTWSIKLEKWDDLR